MPLINNVITLVAALGFLWVFNTYVPMVEPVNRGGA